MNQPSWVERLPAGWRPQRLRHIANISNSNVDKKSYEDGHSVRLCNYTDVYYNDFITDDMELMAATATGEEIRRFRLQPGDVIITKDSESWDDIAVPACVAEELTNVVCGYHLSLFRPVAGRLDGRFLLRALQAQGVREQFWTAANGVTRFGLGQQGMKDALLPVPPLPTQKAIAHFLDRKTAAIDALIEKKQKLLDLLAEKRAALINQAVTKGLDPNVPMKDSGIPWIGEIPAHWEVKRLKHISPRQTVGVVVNPSSYVDDAGEVPFIYGSEVSEGRIDTENARRISHESNKRLSKSQLRAGDLVCVRVGDPGVTAVVPPELDGMNCGSIMIVRQAATFDSHWLCYAMNSKAGRQNVWLVAYGAAQKQYNIGHAVDFVYPVPPVTEQRRIATWLRSRTGRFAQGIGQLAASVERLQEYRQALITAAVTGQLDIGEEAA